MMMFSSKKKKKRSFSTWYWIFCLLIPISCVLLLLNASLPELKKPASTENLDKAAEEVHLGEFGEMMISMLPEDLPFTVFVPSQEAFNRTLRLQSDDSLNEQKRSGTYAMLSRVMGFSAVPKHLPFGSVRSDEVVLYSVSGYTVYVWKDSDGTLVVNNIKSKEVDIKWGELIIHIIHGVLMDAEFAQSLGLDFEE